ncbi:telomere repeat-binding factor 4 [Lycium barbarum]|uniref:telomere repeat-binding factor 4 n=1 Tax=Lycium ferocissimum TaxID=112874 RepID=UPI0028149FB7|nr:telomere repeat-binding factor 4 [Lycium ferocissimum]XP_060188306.1 telomere repeat-binding factor 4 [Lycium barbarum]
MGNPKQKWTSEEEEALRAGVAKHGAGKWKNIQRDPEFNHLLYSRSNIDLKDKWRNLNVSANGQGPRDKSRTQKVKANPDAAAAPLVITQAPVSTTLVPVPQDASADTVMEDSSKCALDGKTASKYNQMIYDALSSLKEPNGSDTSTIVNFLEQRHEVPPNFRRLLSSRLRRLVQQDKLEKIENCYRIKKEVLEKTKTATPKQKHVGPRQLPNSPYLGDTAEEAAITAAYKVAEAENKSFVAAEAAKEAERVSKMEEDSDNSLQVYKDIFEKCSHGEIVLLMA